MTHDVAAQKCIEYIHLGKRLIAESQTTDCSSNGTITYQHLNHLGTPVFTSDENGQTNEAEALMPYGLPYSGNHVQGVGFTGHITDSGSKLSYMQQRYYDPLMRRFLSVDPVTPSTYDGSNLNRYWYANNNPYKYTDPDGRLVWFIPIVAGVTLYTFSEYANAPGPGEETYSKAESGEAALAMLEAIPLGRAAKVAKTAVWAAKPNKSSGTVRNQPNITKPYKRPSGSTTKAQRESVQGKACVDCGAKTPKQYADHKEPLVKEYYRTGTIDKQRMRDINSVQPQCPTCSNKQGAELSKFSREKKKDLGL